jgi:hypothetical protein
MSTAASVVRDDEGVAWQAAEVTSPHLGEPVPVVVARDVSISSTPIACRASAFTCLGRERPHGWSAPAPTPSRAVTYRPLCLGITFTFTVARGGTRS